MMRTKRCSTAETAGAGAHAVAGSRMAPHKARSRACTACDGHPSPQRKENLGLGEFRQSGSPTRRVRDGSTSTVARGCAGRQARRCGARRGGGCLRLANSASGRDGAAASRTPSMCAAKASAWYDISCGRAAVAHARRMQPLFDDDNDGGSRGGHLQYGRRRAFAYATPLPWHNRRHLRCVRSILPRLRRGDGRATRAVSAVRAPARHPKAQYGIARPAAQVLAGLAAVAAGVVALVRWPRAVSRRRSGRAAAFAPAIRPRHAPARGAPCVLARSDPL